MGRPSKLTPETVQKICENIRLGLRYNDAALAAGISYDTFYSWRKKGEAAKSGKYTEFLKAVKRAEAEGERALVARIQKAAQDEYNKETGDLISRGQWTAAAWILERRHREKWGRQLDLTSKGDAIKGYVGISPDDWDEDDDG